MPAWRHYFKQFFGDSLYKINDYDQDMPLQKSGWDLELVFSGYKKPLRCEIKTRRSSYLWTFKKYNDVLVELKGNHDENKIGSGIVNCQADLWCYGFFDGYGINFPMIYDKQRLLDWVISHPKKVRTKFTKGTDVGNGNSYRTKFGLINFSDIKHLQYDPNNIDFDDGSGQTKLFS